MIHARVGALLLAIAFLHEPVWAIQSVQFSEDSFDRTNFNHLTSIAARKKCEDALEASIALVSEAVEMNEVQAAKLKLAGELDIHRFFHDYQATKRTMNFGTISRTEWQAQFASAQAKIEPLKRRYAAGLHGPSSLFAKTLASVLDQPQHESVQALLSERAMTRYTNFIQMTLAIVDRKVPLTRKQRTTIVELLLARTKPPASYGSSTMPVMMVLSRMGDIEGDLKEMFSEPEWAVISRLIQAGQSAVEE